tara:strand:+ start:320 stop:928 length:609 start_codon:yes stop_codon:yes gene_type:complete
MERTILNKVRVLLGMEIELESMKLEDGVTVIEAEVFESGQSVFVVTEDEQKIPLPVGEYALEDGNVLVVAEEGLIGEVKPKSEEEEAPEVEEEVEAEAEAPATEEAKPIKKVVESVSKETFFSEIEALVNENKELKAKLAEAEAPKVEETPEVEAEVEAEVELSEVKPIVHNPEAVENKEQGFRYAKNGNKAMNNIFAKFNK